MFGCVNLDLNKMLTIDCSNIDWQQTGLESAKSGIPIKSDVKLAKCRTQITQTQQESYSAGYKKGQEQFCTYEYGEYWGRNGNAYQGTCPNLSENKFLSGYSKGKLEYDRLQIEKQKADSYSKISDTISQTNSPTSPIPNYPISCTTRFDCEIKDVCIQDPQSNFGTDRVCKKRLLQKCFSDWDCEIKGECNDRKCTFLNK